MISCLHRSDSRYFLRYESLVRVDAAPMTIGPNHCDCVVPFFLDLCRVHVTIDLFLLDQQGTAQLIDATCALAADSQSVGVDFFLHTLLFNVYLFVGRVVVNKRSFFVCLAQESLKSFANIGVNLGNRVLGWNHESYRSSVIGVL